MNRMLRVAGVSVMAVFSAGALCAASLPFFEVAAIRPFDRAGQMGHGSIAVSGPRVTMTGYTLSALILYAYDMRNYQISGGPAWMASDAWTITAKAEGDAAPETAEIRKMLQGLLADRFGVKFHRETKEVRVYFLEPAKTGPRLTTSIAKRPTMQMGPGRLMMAKVTTAQMASMFSSVVSRPVLDRTGISGEFDFTLDSSDINMARTQPLDDEQAGPSVFTAVEEQLGLKLEPGKGPIEILVVEQAAKPAEN